MMTKVLVYGYCVGVFSSRRIERRLVEDIAFRVLAAGNQPNFRTISDFRKIHLKTLEGLFEQVLKIALEAGAMKVGRVALDGTKMKANASKHKAMSYDRMREKEKQLKAEVKQLLEQAEAADAEEDARYGRDRSGDELPAELERRETRLKKIREAKRALEERARQKAAAEGSDPKQAKPKEKDQYNFTDPESRIMKGADGFVQAYNAQAAVEPAFQLIVGQRPRRRARSGHGLQRAPRQHGSHQARQRDQHEPARHQDVAQLVEVGPDLGLVVEVVQLCAVRRQRLGDDQVRHPGDRPPLVCDLACVCEPAQIGWDRQPSGRDAAVGADDGGKRPARGEAGLEPADIALAAMQSRSRDQGVEPAVLQGPARRLVQAVVPDDEVGAERQRARREPAHHHEGDRQPPAQPGGANGCRGDGHTHHRCGRRQHDCDRRVTAT